MLLYNATVYCMDRPAIARGFVRFDEVSGKITEVGEMPAQGLAEEGIDLQGAGIYPGFIDAHTHLGLWEDGLNFEGDDGNEETDPITPHLRAIDAVNPRDRCFAEAREAGITTVLTTPGSANPIGGQIAAIKTAGGRIDGMIVKAPAAMKMALGENPKTVYNGKSQAPMTRMATAALIREQLFKAKAYAEALQRAEESEQEDDGDALDKPEFDMKCEALLPVLRREIQVHFHAHRADDMFTAIRLAKEFHLDYVLVHGTEGHQIAQELREEGARVLSGPFLADRSKPELREQTPASPGILSAAGVPVAIVTDHPVIPVQYLPLCAGLAVREGMAEEAALRAITLSPAEICGIQDRVGSITPGKDADLVVFRGSPLALSAKPERVFIQGKPVVKGQEG